MSAAISYEDQLGNSITLDRTPLTIVSLVPSITELLIDLGLRQELVGCTKFCVHPAGLKNEITVIGGTKTVHIERILALKPDLVIANKEENDRETIVKLQKETNVWVSQIKTLNDAHQMITAIGEMTNTQDRANQIREEQLAMIKSIGKSHGRVAYLIWRDPWMTVGGDTYISDMLEHVGYTNAFKHLTRYPSVDIERLRAADLDMIFLSSEPFPFSEQHRINLQKDLPDTLVRLVDGEFFSWYGTRILHKPNYLISPLIQEPSHN